MLPITAAVLLLSAAPAFAADPVEFEDTILETSIRTALQIENNPLTAADLEQLTALDLMGRKIESLAGLEAATNLQRLNLRDNRVTDLSPLAPLVRLIDLDLRNNRIQDLSPLAGLENLEVLGLRDNRITDISPLAETVQLRELDLRNNRVEDISPMAKLADLRLLGLRDNRVTDITPLAANVRLRHLDLRNNKKISDISALAGLHGLEWLSLRDCIISNIQPLAGLHRLRYIDLHHNRVKDISLLNELPELKWADLRRNHLRLTEDAHALANILLLKRTAEKVHYSPQKNFLKPAAAPAIAKETEAVAESVVHSASRAGSVASASIPPETAIALNSTSVDEAAPNGNATTRLPKESVLFAAGVELTLIFDETDDEFTLRFKGTENTVEVVRSDLGGEYTYTYAVDRPTEAHLLLILGRDDGKGYLHYYELQLIYETADTGLFAGSIESVTDESRPQSGDFRWH